MKCVYRYKDWDIGYHISWSVFVWTFSSLLNGKEYYKAIWDKIYIVVLYMLKLKWPILWIINLYFLYVFKLFIAEWNG